MLDRMQGYALDYMRMELPASRHDTEIPREWRDFMAQRIGKIDASTLIKGDVMEITRKFGLKDEKYPLYRKVRISVVEHGTSRTGHKLRSKPGQQTWHANSHDMAEHLYELRMSSAKTEYKLPSRFNHTGTKAFTNAMRRVKKYWKFELKRLENEILKDMISCMMFKKK